MSFAAPPDLLPCRPRVLPTLRPDAETVATIAAAIEGHDRRVLLLGASPELYAIGRDLTAIEADARQIVVAWPGDRGDRRAVLDDWRRMAPCWGPFTAACGIGALNALDWPLGVRAIFRQLERLLAPGARIAIRCWLTPNRPETLDEVRAALFAGRVSGLAELRLRLAMARPDPAQGPRVEAADFAAAFDRAFGDRAAVARAVGCTTGELDALAEPASPAPHAYPTREELFAILPPAFAAPRLVPAGTHVLAERCPILIADFVP
jgi:hypothetical protein